MRKSVSLICLFVVLQVVLGTKVGRAKHMRIMPGGALETESATSIFVGRKLDEHRGAFYLEYPMDKGAVTETGWDAMERLWEVSIYVVAVGERDILFESLPIAFSQWYAY
jgi:actin-related protein